MSRPRLGPGDEALELTTPLTAVKGVPIRRAEAMLELGVRNVGQLIAYLPMRHEREEAEGRIADLLEGANAAARGEVTAVRLSGGSKPRLQVAIDDGSGRLDLVFFNQPYLKSRIHPGMRLIVQGKTNRYGHGLQMANPKWTEIRLNPDGSEPGQRSDRLRPVYPACEAIASAEIEKIIQAVIEPALALVQDHLPEVFRAERSLVGLSAAYRMMHAPADEKQVALARRRLSYDELLMLQLAISMKRSERAELFRAVRLESSPAIDRAIRERFPFALTADQDAVIAEIAKDLARTVPANRLIQGDVGSGKTAVAVYAMLLAAAQRHQSALMAPTELLAEQHFASLRRFLGDSKLRMELLTGAAPASEKRRILSGLADGSIDLIVGTHALLTERVAFKSLAVAIIDEQHRFGVHQRSALRERGTGDGGEPLRHATTPHTLVMTATPIPRTLAMTLFGDLDVSVIRGMPPGRKPIATRVVGRSLRDEVYRFVAKRIGEGDQAYVVVPMIGDIEASEFSQGRLIADDAPEPDGVTADPDAAQTASWMTLAKAQASFAEPGHPLAGLRIGVVHGRLDSPIRERTMQAFRRGELDVLLATTVIEVGVDVPNATVMVIEDADRFGLAQLHQLRGRVGRGAKPSACVLIADPVTPLGIQRLEVMRATSDGFKLAEKDFELRGFGDVLGVRQSGMPPFRIVELPRDTELLLLARRDASAWIERSPTLAQPDEALIRRRMLKAHGQWLGLADVA